MHFPFVSRYVALLGSVLPVVGSLTATVAIAQAPPACQPPNANEYLLLVMRDSQQTETRLQQALPPNATSTVCTYLDGVVVRVGGFTNAEVANTWAQYLGDLGGLQAFVVRPSTGTASPGTASPQTASPATPASSFPTPTAVSPTPATPAPEPGSAASALPEVAPAAIAGGPATPVTPTPSPAATPIPAATPAPMRPFNPQPLGDGFAVVVNYFNRPEVAADVGQLLARDVGLVAYEQNPYLLAVYTADPAVAMSILQTLSDRGFAATIIDSRKAVLLTPAVAASPLRTTR